jgi:hypothetical protein
VPVVLHPVEPLLCLSAVSSLPQPLHIEACCFGEVVFRRLWSFIVGQVYLVVNLIRQDLRIICVARIIVTIVKQAFSFVICCAIALVVRGGEIFIVL